MFLMAAVLATAASPSPLASDERADEKVDSRLTRSSSSFMESYWLASTTFWRILIDILNFELVIGFSLRKNDPSLPKKFENILFYFH